MISAQYRKMGRDTEHDLERLLKLDVEKILDYYGRVGVEALREATPKDTGLTADSWSYEITKNGSVYGIAWSNSHVEKGYAKIAVLLDVGHGTANGGYVSGRKYIEPALRPVFDKIAADTWTEVTRIV